MKTSTNLQYSEAALADTAKAHKTANATNDFILLMVFEKFDVNIPTILSGLCV